MIWRGLSSAFVLAFAASSLTTTRAFCAPAVSASGAAFERGDDFSGWLPFEFFGGARIFVTVKVNGHPVKAMLDSGASATVIDGRFAGTLGLRPHGDAAGDGAGGGGRYGEVEGVKLGLGDMTITAHPAVVIDLADVERQLGHPLPIILGGEVFRQSVVDIDFRRRRIAFRDPSRFKAPAEAQSAALTPAGEGEAITAMVEERPAKLLFDLGNGSALSLTPRFWDRPDFLRGRRVSSTLSGGWGGMSVRGLTLIGDLMLAGSSFSGLPATLDHGAAQGAGQTSLDGNVGIAVLNRFHLIVDFPHERVLFAPPVDPAAPFANNRAGLALKPLQAGSEVLYVAPGSPAAAVGFVKGDVISDVHHAGGRREDARRTQWMSGPAGEALEVRLGDQRILHLTLRDYI